MSLRTLPTEELLAFTNTLTTHDYLQLTPEDINKISEFVNSDGCSGVPDFYLAGCVVHDFWYRTHRNLDGTAITKDQADEGLKAYIQSKSIFGKFSPMAAWRRWGLRHFADKAWN